MFALYLKFLTQGPSWKCYPLRIIFLNKENVVNNIGSQHRPSCKCSTLSYSMLRTKLCHWWSGVHTNNTTHKHALLFYFFPADPTWDIFHMPLHCQAFETWTSRQARQWMQATGGKEVSVTRAGVQLNSRLLAGMLIFCIYRGFLVVSKILLSNKGK